jgi:nicotinate-nucleotide--dimethylbenzimidazole phosphoribosyltransferase
MEFPVLQLAPIDNDARKAALVRQDQLTKPTGALGLLEATAVQLAGILRSERPQICAPAALIFAADHPVTQHGVSAYPAEVTAAMVNNFARGGAAASVLARLHGASLHIIDVGVLHATQPWPGTAVTLHREAVADDACGDIANSDAMTAATFGRAFAAGVAAVDRLPAECNLVALGEMGIGNTTCAAALLKLTAANVTGAGTGVGGEVLARKIAVVQHAANRATGLPPAEILRICGGRELVAIAGAALRAAATGRAVLVDGFIVTAAIACAVQAVPALRSYLIFAHRSAERGHAALLHALHAAPLIDLELRLGECSGALLALPLIQAACGLHNQMATFADAAVPDRSPV